MPVRLTTRPLSVPSAYRNLRDDASGGAAVFVGRVRPDRRRGFRVAALEYEAHATLALRALRSLEQEARRRFGARRVFLVHRLGTVPVGAPSVIVAVACPHRAAAFAACRFLIERLKRRVPIWKSDRVQPARRPRRRPPRRSER
jgi:molybdopterin synthase catalytic subunit